MERRVAIDTESNSLHRYPERLCLVQLAGASNIYLIDPLGMQDLTPLGALLADERVEKVVHSADYDIRSLDRQYGFRIKSLFDTSIAAQFAGFTRLGLAAIAQDLLGKTMAKDKSLQRADWSLRPLSSRAIEYASEDVRYLFILRDLLSEKLASLGRAEWVAEECARLAAVRYVAPDRDKLFLSVKGASTLGPKGLASLKALAFFREREALQSGRPPFRILPDSTLVFLAANPQANLEDAPGLGPYGLSRWGPGLRQAIEEGLTAAPIFRPKTRGPIPTAQEQARLKALKEWRLQQAQAMALDAPVLWPTISLERLARAPGAIEAETGSLEVRQWQRSHIAPLLRDYLATQP